MRVNILLSFLIAIFISACGDNNPTGSNRQTPTGALQISTATSGDDVDSDGYTLVIDGEDSTDVNTNTTVVVAEFAQGYKTLDLHGIASNCSTEGSNPRDVAIFPGDTTTVNYSVQCLEVAHNKIVFHSNRDGNYDIYMMNPDGTRLTQLTSSYGDDKFPVFSKNATHITFVSDRGGSTQLMKMKIDGSEMQTLTATNFGDFGEPYALSSWSPDHSRIVFEKSYELLIVDSDGGNETPLNSGSGEDPSWSPVSNMIAYVDDPELYKIKADGSQKTLLAGFNDNYGNPDSTITPRWSPDGTRIAAAMSVNGVEDLYSINADGTGFVRLTDYNNSNQLFPSWSPDGSRIVYQSDRYGDNDIYIINADGSGFPDLVTSDNAEDGSPHWSPEP